MSHVALSPLIQWNSLLYTDFKILYIYVKKWFYFHLISVSINLYQFSEKL